MTTLEEISEVFLAETGWVGRYNHIVELAARLPVMPDHLKTQGNRVECASMLYFSAAVEDDRLRVHAYANTAIPAGLACLLVDTFDDVPVADLPQLLARLTEFLRKSELVENLTLPRRSALLSMIARVASLS